MAQPDTQRGLVERKWRERRIDAVGLVAAMAEIVAGGRMIPYPFNDQRRLEDIVLDTACPRDWRAAARFLLVEIEHGRLPEWPGVL